jgi:hypothetical protein
VVVDAKGERKLIKSVRREERTDRGRSNASQTVMRGVTDNRRGDQGTWKKKNKNRFSSSDSDIEQDQLVRARTRK